MVRIKTTAFSTLKPGDMVTYSQTSHNAVSADPQFVDIEPTPAAMQTAINSLASLIPVAQTGTRIDKDNRDAAYTVVLSYLFQWAGFVSMLANRKTTEQEQIAVVNAAALEVASKGGAIGPLSAVENLRTKSLSESIFVEWAVKKGAHSYKVMKTAGYATEQSTWEEYTITTRSKLTIPAPAGEVFSFAIYPIGTAGIGAVSEFVTGMATL